VPSRDRDDARRPRRCAEQHGGRKDSEVLHEGQAEGDGEARQQQRQDDVPEARTRPRTERRGRLLERGIYAGDVGQREQERERKAVNDEGDEDAPIVVHEAYRSRGETGGEQQAVEPALRPQVVEQPLGNQHRAERDRQHEDRGEQALMAQQAHAHGDRDRHQDVEHGHRQRQPQRRADGLIQERVGEEALIVGEPADLLGTGARLERKKKTIEERVDEQPQDEQRRRQHEQRSTVDAALGQTQAQRRPLVGEGISACRDGWARHAAAPA
jgi:hypothetical protein